MRTFKDLLSEGYAVDDHSLNDEPGVFDAPSGNLQAAFLPAVLVPMSAKEDAFAEDRWSNLTYEQMHKDAYKRQLWASDIGVLCGKASFNLCCIVFTVYKAWEDFLKINPGFGKGLITANSSQVFVWLRIEGSFPENTELNDASWVSQGPIIQYQRNSLDQKYAFINLGQPLVVRFYDIHWSEEQLLSMQPFMISLKRGHPFRMDPKLGRVLNENYWGDYYVSKNPLRYDAGMKRFLRCNEIGEWKCICEEMVLSELQNFIAARLYSTKDITDFCTEEHLRTVMNAMRLLVPIVHSVSEVEQLEDFVMQKLERNEQSDLTVNEVFDAYQACCLQMGMKQVSKDEFQRLLPKLLQQHFRCSKSKSISRGGVNKRGFRNLSFKSKSKISRGGMGRLGRGRLKGG